MQDKISTDVANKCFGGVTKFIFRTPEQFCISRGEVKIRLNSGNMLPFSSASFVLQFVIR